MVPMVAPLDNQLALVKNKKFLLAYAAALPDAVAVTTMLLPAPLVLLALAFELMTILVWLVPPMVIYPVVTLAIVWLAVKYVATLTESPT